MKHPLTLTTIALAVAGTLTGCAGYQAAQKEVDERSQEMLTKVKTVHETQAVPDNKGKLPLVTHASGAWFGAKTVPLAPDADLPSAFNKRVTMLFPGRVNISTVAERITNVTGVPVRVKPDVFMPATSLMPQGAAQGMLAAAAAPVPGQPVPNPAQPMAMAPNPAAMGSAVGAGLMAAAGYANEMEVNYVGDLAGFLNLASARFGINWEYRDGAIQFYRLVTKTFSVKANPGSSKFNTSIGKSGGTQAGATGGSVTNSSSSTFNSNMSVDTTSDFSVWDNIAKQFDAVKSGVGRYAIAQSTGSVTAMDTKEVIDEMGKIIDHENAILSKQVMVKVEVMSVAMDNGDEFGLDWSLVYSKLSSLTPQWTLKSQSIGSLTSAEAGSLGIQVVAPVTNDNSLTQRLTGSQALFKALNTIGRANTEIKNTVSTMNRQAVPVALTDQDTYLASTTPGVASTSGGASGLPGLTPGMVTTGYLMNIQPTVQENDAVMLKFSLDLSTLKKLGIISTGSGATQQSIQTPSVSGTQMQNQFGVRSGETLVLTGFERSIGQYDKRTLAEGASIGLGGSISGKRTREAILILITPYISEGV